MAKLIALLLGGLIYVALVLGAGILGMIYGWGVEPQNWWWISLSYILVFVGIGFNALVQATVNS